MLALQEVGGHGGYEDGSFGAGGWDDHGISGGFGAAREAMGLPNHGVGEMNVWDTIASGINRFGDIYQQRQQNKLFQRTGQVIPIQPATRHKDFMPPGPAITGGGIGGVGKLSPGLMIAAVGGLVLVLVLTRR